MDIRVDNSELASVLFQIEAKGRSLGGVMPQIAQVLQSAVRDKFDQEGPGWKDLAESTKKARSGSSYKILQDTGELAKSVDTGYGSDWVEAFAGVSYAIFHSAGTETMPRRDPFDLEASKAIWDDAQKDILELVLGAVA